MRADEQRLVGVGPLVVEACEDGRACLVRRLLQRLERLGAPGRRQESELLRKDDEFRARGCSARVGGIGGGRRGRMGGVGGPGLPAQPVYRVSFPQVALWPDYDGPADDTTVVDLFEPWLEPEKTR